MLLRAAVALPDLSPWLLSAGTWTLGLLGFGGQPRPHNPPSAPSSCLTPPWPRSEDRKIRAVPSQRDSFILPAGTLPVTRAYIMGNIARPRRKHTPHPIPPFPHWSILPSLPHLLSLLHFFSHSPPAPFSSFHVHSASPPVCDIFFRAHSPGQIYYRQPWHNPEAEPLAVQRRRVHTHGRTDAHMWGRAIAHSNPGICRNKEAQRTAKMISLTMKGVILFMLLSDLMYGIRSHFSKTSSELCVTQHDL